MKKIISGLLTVVMCMCLMGTAGAVCEDSNNVTVENVSQENVVGSDCGEQEITTKARTVKNLSDGSVELDWSLKASRNKKSQYDYKTNTGEINIYIYCDPEVSLRVVLYDSDSNVVGQYTKEVGSILGKGFSFSGLTAADTYYFRIYNLGQKDVELTGSIYD